METAGPGRTAAQAATGGRSRSVATRASADQARTDAPAAIAVGPSRSASSRCQTPCRVCTKSGTNECRYRPQAWPVRHRRTMARAYRLLEPSGIYHVTTSAVEDLVAFRSDGDRLHFLQLLDRVVSRQGWRCQAYCLLGTHYHLLLQTPSADLSVGMHRLNGIYAQGFNKRHERRGHLFGDRFNSVTVRSDAHLLELSRYIALNPSAPASATSPSSGSGAATPRRSACAFRHRSSTPTAC